MAPDVALTGLRALLDHARASDADALSILLDLAEAVARCTDTRAADLLAVLGAPDLAVCSPRTVLRCAVLIGRLRLDDGDDAARAGRRSVRRREAPPAPARRARRRGRGDDPPRAEAAAIFIAADDETLGWQGDALTALGERGRPSKSPPAVVASSRPASSEARAGAAHGMSAPRRSGASCDCRCHLIRRSKQGIAGRPVARRLVTARSITSPRRRHSIRARSVVHTLHPSEVMPPSSLARYPRHSMPERTRTPPTGRPIDRR